MKKFTRTTALLGLAAALGLVACSGKPEAKGPLNESGAAAPLDNESDNATTDISGVVDPDHPPVLSNQAASEPVGDPNALPPTDGPGPGVSAQVRDDADASGMTARLPDQAPADPSAPPPAQPVQQK